jgi:hypothetical protein
MKKKALTTTEIILIVFLLVLAIGAAWYLFFFKPVQADIASLKNQAGDMQAAVEVEAAKLAKMDARKAELDAIFAENPNPSEIAPYDNVQNVMNQLNDILAKAKQYNLSFSNPTTDKSGIVRRTVTMSLTANSYEDAKAIMLACEQNHWRCIIKTMSMTGSNTSSSLVSGDVSLSAVIVFFESVNLKPAEAE